MINNFVTILGQCIHSCDSRVLLQRELQHLTILGQCTHSRRILQLQLQLQHLCSLASPSLGFLLVRPRPLVAAEAVRSSECEIARIALVCGALSGRDDSPSTWRHERGAGHMLRFDRSSSRNGLVITRSRDRVQVVLAEFGVPRHLHVWVVRVAASFGKRPRDVLHELEGAGGVVMRLADAGALAWDSRELVRLLVERCKESCLPFQTWRSTISERSLSPLVVRL
jgi:hypothetical protein